MSEWTPIDQERGRKARRFSDAAVINAHFGLWAKWDQPSWLRVVLLAAGDCNRTGHAEFVDGDLAKLLGMPNRTLRAAIARAVGLGWLTDRSSARCLELNPDHVQPGAGRSGYGCWQHKVGSPSKVKPPLTMDERRARKGRRRADEEEVAAAFDLSRAVVSVKGRRQA